MKYLCLIYLDEKQLAAMPEPEMGQLNEAVHMWGYKDLNERAAVRAAALADPDWQAFLGRATPLLLDMKSVILVPAPSSPMK